MSFIEKTKAMKIAERIDALNQETMDFVRSQMRAAFDLANTPGLQQDIMDSFGPMAAKALGVYATFYGALETIGENSGLRPVNLEIFEPAPDGRVRFNDPEASTEEDGD
jgi:hypothetical protein